MEQCDGRTAVCYFIARILGRDVAEKLTSKAGMQQIDTFFKKYGKNTVLICFFIREIKEKNGFKGSHVCL